MADQPAERDSDGTELAAEQFSLDRRIWQEVGKAAAVGLVLGLAILLLGHLLGAKPSPVLSVGLPTAAGALLQLVLLTFNESMPVDSRPATPAPDNAAYLVKRRQLERQLRTAGTDADNFDWNVRPMLVRLATDRLRHKHGINALREPERARAIVGEQLWLMMSTPQSVPSSVHGSQQLTALVAAIEAI